MPTGSTSSVDYKEIADRLTEGMIVPFFGAGASACCGLPGGRDLAQRLVSAGEFPDLEGKDDLALVAAYVVQNKDYVALQRELRAALTVTHAPGRLHKVIAGCKAVSLYVTTNYDDLLETALADRRPWVVVDRGTPGTVWYRGAPTDEWKQIKAGNLRTAIREFQTGERPVILKLHGSLEDRRNDSFLITEDDYVDFLGRPDNGQIPPILFEAMQSRSFLFLGYGLRDWNVRVLLRRLSQARPPKQRISSWAIVRQSGAAEKALWRNRDVALCDVELDCFATELEQAISAGSH
jgi:hypothetical protein